MGNEKSCQNINCFFFLIKTFFNWILTSALKTLISMTLKINYEKIILIFLKVETFSNRILIGVQNLELW